MQVKLPSRYIFKNWFWPTLQSGSAIKSVVQVAVLAKPSNESCQPTINLMSSLWSQYFVSNISTIWHSMSIEYWTVRRLSPLFENQFQTLDIFSSIIALFFHQKMARCLFKVGLFQGGRPFHSIKFQQKLEQNYNKNGQIKSLIVQYKIEIGKDVNWPTVLFGLH